MQGKDIHLYGEYAARPGKYGDTSRVIILQPTPVWGNSISYPWHHVRQTSGDLSRNYVRAAGGRYGEKKWACAIEVPQQTFFTNDPETGEPWENLNWFEKSHGQDGKWLVTGSHWFPIAVSSREIIHPWSEELEIRRKKAEEKRIADLAYEAHQAQRRREQEERQAKIEERRKEAERLRNLFVGQQSEFYEVHLEPRLIELGIEHKPEITFHTMSGTANEGKYVSRATITLTFEQMLKLLDAATHE